MKHLILFPFLFIGMNLAYAQPTTAEYNALMDLYNSTTGSSWTNNTGWSTADPGVVQSVAGWYGIVVDTEGHVTKIKLYVNGLSGVLPASIGDLPYLRELSLNGNQLSGPIPSEVGSLSNLELLELQNNLLSSSIPSSVGVLTNLIRLDLSGNQLTGSIPHSIDGLESIEIIHLGGNQLSGSIPAEITDLTTLKYLYLHSNSLTGSIPSDIGDLTNLIELALQVNGLSGTVPPSLGALEDLVYLQLQSNQLSGSIPSEIGDLSQLQGLILSSNQLSGAIPATISGLTNIKSIELAGNQLTGPLPDELGSLATLEFLYLNNNSINGSIPSALGGLASLKVLFLQGNSLSGPIPSSLGQLSNLTYLALQANELDGPIPDELGDLANLEDLVLSNNYLSGVVPPTFEGLSKIKSIQLSGNYIEGPLPIELGSLPTLLYLHLNNNEISGEIPSTFGSLSALRELLLQGNSISGEIPETLGNLSNLISLELSSNEISGDIPSEIGNLNNLKFLRASSNQLSGTIPDSFDGLGSIEVIDLSGNVISGPLPAELGALNTLQSLSLNNNDITGTIPAEFSGMSGLTILLLQNNGLSGTIPSFTNLSQLYIQNNKFTFSDFLGLKQSRSWTAFEYSGQGVMDEIKTVDAVVGAAVVLTTSFDRNTSPSSLYQWFKVVNGTSQPLNSASSEGHTYTISSLTETDAQAEYYYTITNPSAPGLTLSSQRQRIILTSPSTLTDINYVRTLDVTVAGKRTPADLDNAVLHERIINYTYFDGLGRPVQNVAQQGSPTGRDIVQPVHYDEFGREQRKYLPIVTGSNGGYKLNEYLIDEDGDYIGVAQAFYADSNDETIVNDSRPFAEVVFEPSPLNRPDKEYGAGENWAPAPVGANKFIQHQYISNQHSITGSLTEEKVIAWKLDGSGLPAYSGGVSGYIEEGGFYSSFQLSVKITIDEQGHAVREYTNKQGQVILKKVQVATVPTNLNDVDQWACTYYIYDDLNNLVFVLPPEGVKQLLLLQN